MKKDSNLEKEASTALANAALSRRTFSEEFRAMDPTIKDFLIRRGYVGGAGNYFNITKSGREYAQRN